MTAVKLAVASDLHLPVTPADKLAGLARAVAASAPDLVVLAGDLAESLADFSRVLAMFRKEAACPVAVLPGDVDFWARPPYDSRRLWTELLPEAAADGGCVWLEGRSLKVGPVAVAGSVGWYDYSAAALAGMVSDLEFAQQKYLHNADALRIDWEYSDPEFAGRAGAGLVAALDALEGDPAVEQVVVVTHFPILEGQLTRRPGAGFASAYAGNLTLGRKVAARPKVRHVVSGHTRQPKHGELIRDGMPPLSYHVLPGDYERPTWLGLTLG
ncbi:MAG: metallophosphoesterase [Gemmataceae bacterium]